MATAPSIQWLAVGILHNLRPLAPWNLLQTLDEVRQLSTLRTQVEQCMAVYQGDARPTPQLDKALKRIEHPRVLAQVRAAVAAASLEPDPCPHIVLEGLLPDGVYDELLAAIPPPLFFDHLEVNRQDLKVPFEFAPRYNRDIWTAFQTQVVAHGLEPALVEKFRDGLDTLVRTQWPGRASMTAADISLRPINARIMRRRPGYEIKPHRDPRWAFLTCIMYLTPRDDTRLYGTQLCRLRHEREAPSHSPFYVAEHECEVVQDVPGRPNTAVVFLNSTGVHRASIPPNAPPDTDRYIYQLQFGPARATRDTLLAELPEKHLHRWNEKTGTQIFKS